MLERDDYGSSRTDARAGSMVTSSLGRRNSTSSSITVSSSTSSEGSERFEIGDHFGDQHFRSGRPGRNPDCLGTLSHAGLISAAESMR